MTTSSVLDKADDALDRAAFVTSLKNHIKAIALLDDVVLPAPRVIAVDAPWGSGKTWIAHALSTELAGDTATNPVAFIDAFRHDHHPQVFPIIASAVMESLKPNGERKKKWLSAAGSVLAGVASVAIKEGASAALQFVNMDPSITSKLDDAKTKAIEGTSKFGEKQVEALFKRYSETQATQDKFMSAMSSITKDLPQPFVVIIDELDRCRPSFALEVLEQIKHLFAAKNVVFVLFWNSKSIHESIRHTYGQGTEAESYLSKFVALSIPVPNPTPLSASSYGLFSGFVAHELRRLGAIPSSDMFPTAISQLGEALNATLRDIQKVVSAVATGLATKTLTQASPIDFTYVTLLRTLSHSRYNDVKQLKPESLKIEAALLKPFVDKMPSCKQMWATLLYLSDRQFYRRRQTESYSSENCSEEQLQVLQLSHLNERGSSADWLVQAMKVLEDQLINRRA